jgi:S1-C subfamily serine protease
LVSVEGKEITKIKDIHHALEEKGWGNDITFTIIREGMEKKITVKLPPSED